MGSGGVVLSCDLSCDPVLRPSCVLWRQNYFPEMSKFSIVVVTVVMEMFVEGCGQHSLRSLSGGLQC